MSQSSAATVNPAANRRRGDRGSTAHLSLRKHQTVVLEAVICFISLFLSLLLLFHNNFISALVHSLTFGDKTDETKSDTNISANLFLTQICLQSSQLISHHAALDLVLCLGVRLYVFRNARFFWYFMDLSFRTRSFM